MTKHTFQITLSADSPKEAETKIKALSVLASRLSATELDKLAYIILYDPQKTAIAKKALGV